MSSLDRKLKEYAGQLHHQALHDLLTGLPNRTLFADRLEHATARSARGVSALAVFFIDLDGFKQVNDRHGHAIGDMLLQAVGARLQASLRLGDTVARLGGDEFVVLLEDLEHLESARQAADRLAQSIARPFTVGDDTYTISASIGVAFCPAGFTRSSDLLRDADRAMYQAKATGNGRYQVIQPLVA
jgi:diguanylate cyclase (GGDEF)-like protein